MTGQCNLLSVSAFRLLLWFLLSLFPSSSVCLLFFFSFLLAWVSSSFLFRFVRLVRGRCNPETRLMLMRWLAGAPLLFCHVFFSSFSCSLCSPFSPWPPLFLWEETGERKSALSFSSFLSFPWFLNPCDGEKDGASFSFRIWVWVFALCVASFPVSPPLFSVVFSGFCLPFSPVLGPSTSLFPSSSPLAILCCSPSFFVSSPFKTKTMVVKARGAAGWWIKIFPRSVPLSSSVFFSVPPREVAFPQPL